MTATSIEPELWVERASAAVAFYEAAFGAATLLRVGDGDDTVARLEVGDTRFWVGAAGAELHRLGPETVGGPDAPAPQLIIGRRSPAPACPAVSRARRR